MATGITPACIATEAAGDQGHAHRAYPEFRYTVDWVDISLEATWRTWRSGRRGAASSLGPRSATLRAVGVVRRTHAFDVGDTRFEVFHTPGETPDHSRCGSRSSRPRSSATTTYESFPNLEYSSGTRPRWALEMELVEQSARAEPELVLPSHGPAIRGRDEVRRG
jgi:glyoxylase-like metal-dependent hydrolase (beta-lactamase superfamily II)